MRTRIPVCLLVALCVSVVHDVIAEPSPAVIDPEVAYATYLGGSFDDSVASAVLCPDGDVLFAGQTSSTNFPTQDPYQGKPGGSSDAFMTRINGKGDTIVMSTYLGGNSIDTVNKVLLDDDQNIYLVGDTYSTNFPMEGGGYQTNFGGQRDVYIVKMNKDASAILAATYFGGSSADFVMDALLDGQTNIYISGMTGSSDLPVTNAFQTNYVSGTDGFFAQFNNDLTVLHRSSFFGGGDLDLVAGIAVNERTGELWLGGYTDSTNLPITNALFDVTISNRTAFVSQIASNGQDLLFSTYLGGSSGSYLAAIGLYTNESLLVAGYTDSPDFPVTNAFQDAFSGEPDGENAYDGFLCMLMPDPTGLVFSTYLGGAGDDRTREFFYDDQGRIYLGGYTASTDFPVTVNAHQPTKGLPTDDFWRDFFFSVFTPDGSALEYSTYFGATAHDYLNTLLQDDYGAVYLCGYYDSGTDWPTTNALYASQPGDEDGAIVKFVEPYMAFQGSTVNDGALELDWISDSRRSLDVEYADSPTDAWNPLEGHTNIACGGGSITVTVAVPAVHRVYRLRPAGP